MAFWKDSVAAPSGEGVLGLYGLVDAFDPLESLAESDQHVHEMTTMHLGPTDLFMCLSKNIQELGTVSLKRSLQRFLPKLVRLASTLSQRCLP